MAKKTLQQNVVELIENNHYSKLITFGPDNAPRGRIMTNLPLGKNMVIWFATGLSTSKIKDIKKNSNVSVFVDDADDMTNASIAGKAEIVTDSRLLKKFWQEPFEFFFPGGPTNPDYCLLKITPTKLEYLKPGPMFLQHRTRLTVKL